MAGGACDGPESRLHSSLLGCRRRTSARRGQRMKSWPSRRSRSRDRLPCSAATGRSSRSAAAARARSGSPGTSRRAARSRSRSSPREGTAAARAEREAEAAARLATRAACAPTTSAATPSHVYIVYEYVPGRTLREAMRAGELDDADRGRGRRADPRRARARARARHRPPRRQAGERAARRRATGVAVRLLDFGLALMRRGRHADRGRRRAGHARLHLARAARRARRRRRPADVWAVGVLLWEALAGCHPFWTSSLLDTAKAIQEGAPPLATARPDLPRRAARASSTGRLSLDPAARPSARGARRRAARRCAAAPSRARQGTVPQQRPGRPVRIGPGRRAGVALAAIAAGLGAASLPFFPAGWAGSASRPSPPRLPRVRARAGLALALAAPILPLGNLSLGLALAYAAVRRALARPVRGASRGGAGCLALGAAARRRSARSALAAARPRSESDRPVRRAVAAAGVVLAGAAAAGIRGSALPFARRRARRGARRSPAPTTRAAPPGRSSTCSQPTPASPPQPPRSPRSRPLLPLARPPRPVGDRRRSAPRSCPSMLPPPFPSVDALPARGRRAGPSASP